MPEMECMMEKELVFLTDQERNTILEVITGSVNAALPDCYRPFNRLEPNTSDGAAEKHLPVIEKEKNRVTVKVGDVFHPMSQEHSIEWVCLCTEAGAVMRVGLSPDCEPVAHFTLEEGDKPVAAYAYCNLHGFWKTKIS